MFNIGNHKNPSVMQHKFSEVPRAEIPRSTFDRSHGHKTTFDAGYLVPIFIDEALPGDTHTVRMTGFARLATPIFPLMDNMVMDTHFFSVPVRLLWDNWQKFNGEQTDPGDSTDFLVPQVAGVGNEGAGSLWDYLGVPTGQFTDAISISALFSRAYNLIYNEWYRDQNLQDSVVVDRGDGPDDKADYVLLRRGKRHDYFTSALPWPQKGDSVSIPLGTLAPVVSNTLAPNFTNASGDIRNLFMDNAGPPVLWSVGGVPTAPTIDGTAFFGSITGLHADLSTATAATINSLRQAFQIQKLLERDARGGTRYTEIVRSHFGVTSPDARLQRPEFLGGGSSPVTISPVPQTGSTDATSPQGNLAAIGTALLSNHGFTASFTEHCVLIGIVSVRADLTYQQGFERMWHRRTRYDFYWPALAHLGEQAILRKEIFATGNDVDDEIIFGYQERFAEYRYKPSRISGLFRSTVAGTLDSWHLSQEFATAPVLDAAFIVENPPVDRVIAVPAEPHFLFDSYFQMRSARPMPVYGVPGLIDHF